MGQDESPYNFGRNVPSINNEQTIWNEHFFNASNSTALVEAFNKIKDDINTGGYGTEL